ncbi:MAG: polysaccharide deacetylase [Puniceicoccaceae bacterium 5H]|nr:MAG: polysaccharide deacetylase [Puniceicoccaceae bacterium 5H]
MKTALLLSLLTCVSAFASAETFEWPGHRHAAVVLTYDDALESHLSQAVPALDAEGLKGTFFLTGTLPEADLNRWRDVAAEGHELGNHSVFHPCAEGSFEMPPQYYNENYSIQTMLAEIDVMNTLLAAIDGKRVHSYAMPCGQTVVGGEDYVDELRTAGSVTYARAIDSPIADPLKIDPFRVPSIWFPEDVTGEELIDAVKDVQGTGALQVFGFHGVGGDYLIVPAEAHEELLAYLHAHEDEIWVTTFSEAMDYLTQKQAEAKSVANAGQ